MHLVSSVVLRRRKLQKKLTTNFVVGKHAIAKT